MYIVSKCLAGEPCRYDGKDNLVPEIRALVERGEAVAVCPEALGGLPTPRAPSEIQPDGRILSKTGEDVTEAFLHGAERAAAICRAHGCTGAILKARSPSCGKGLIYDGSFTGKRAAGNGVFAQMLLDAGIPVMTEEEYREKERPADFSYCKLEIFIPETHLEPLRRALREVDAGHVGNYDCCLSYCPVTGCWRPLEGTSPYLGSVGELSREPELKVEVTVRAARVDETIAAIRRVHPYEEPVINAIPLWRTSF
jgi:uncharacterized protein YbbK (DUF523 family)